MLVELRDGMCSLMNDTCSLITTEIAAAHLQDSSVHLQCGSSKHTSEWCIHCHSANVICEADCLTKEQQPCLTTAQHQLDLIALNRASSPVHRGLHNSYNSYNSYTRCVQCQYFIQYNGTCKQCKYTITMVGQATPELHVTAFTSVYATCLAPQRCNCSSPRFTLCVASTTGTLYYSANGVPRRAHMAYTTHAVNGPTLYRFALAAVRICRTLYNEHSA
eukprot:17115-Heterococcus_DN1.PRE.5